LAAFRVLDFTLPYPAPPYTRRRGIELPYLADLWQLAADWGVSFRALEAA
jgi:hypothetical protein